MYQIVRQMMVKCGFAASPQIIASVRARSSCLLSSPNKRSDGTSCVNKTAEELHHINLLWSTKPFSKASISNVSATRLLANMNQIINQTVLNTRSSRRKQEVAESSGRLATQTRGKGEFRGASCLELVSSSAPSSCSSSPLLQASSLKCRRKQTESTDTLLKECFLPCGFSADAINIHVYFAFHTRIDKKAPVASGWFTSAFRTTNGQAWRGTLPPAARQRTCRAT